MAGTRRLARRVPARLTASQGTRFGLTLGCGFLAVGAILLWRDRQLAAVIAGGLGIVLACAGLLVPTRLGPIERGWMALAQAISKVTTPVFMALVYYTAVFPIGVVMRALRRNPLVRSADGGSFWVAHEQRDADHMKHQF
jgi:hypothetical protein